MGNHSHACAQTRTQGNVDLEHLESLLSEHGDDGIAYVRVEACVNMAGGQPFALQNLRRVRELTHKYNVCNMRAEGVHLPNVAFLSAFDLCEGTSRYHNTSPQSSAVSDVRFSH